MNKENLRHINIQLLHYFMDFKLILKPTMRGQVLFYQVMWISDCFECCTHTCILTLENLIKDLNVLEQLSQRLEVNTKYISKRSKYTENK